MRAPSVHRLLLGIATLCLLGRATIIHAQVNLPDPLDAIQYVGSDISPTVNGSDDPGGILYAAVSSFVPIVNVVAVLILVISALFLVLGQTETQLQNARRTLFAVGAALVLVNIAGPITNALIAGFEASGGNGAAGASILSNEVIGLMFFIETPLAVIAILMIVVSGIRAILTFGSDEGITNIRRTILSIMGGIILIGAKFIISQTIVINRQPGPVIGVILTITSIVLRYMALAGVVMMCIAGIILIANKGDEDALNKAKQIFGKVAIGFAIILMSFGIAQVVLSTL